MTTHSPQELLKAHGIDYVANKSGKFTTTCPNCGQGYLNVTVQRDKVAWYCHQCDVGASEAFEQKDKAKNGDSGLGPIRAIYDYQDESGKLLFQVMRFEPPGQPKQFRQRKDPHQEKWSIKGVRIVPFHLPELTAALASDRVVFVVEGEKDVNALWAVDVPATCNPMGANKWWPEFNEILKDADVVICGDNDQPGRDHVAMVAKNLQGFAKRIRVLDLAQFWPDIEASDDVSDWLHGHSVDLLWQIVGDLPDYKPPNGNGNGETHAPAAVAGEPAILSHAQFLEGFVPPDYLIEGMLQRRFIYALTGQTGHAKTAVALLIARLVSCADKNATLKRHRVEKGRVVYFVGENPDDVRMRIIGADAERSDQPDLDDIWFIPGVFNIAGMTHVLSENFKRQGECSLIIIDTSAAYFLGNEELSNTQMGAYARMLRTLTTLPGGPCVLVLCHPIKHVIEPDQLLPRGGGAYLAEMDGNLTLWRKTDDMVELNYNKMRGPGFQPIAFKLETIRNKALVDNKGRILPTVQAVAIDDAEEDQRANTAENDEDRVLTAVLAQPKNSLAGWAKQLGWVSETGEPYKMRVQRIVERLAKQHPILTRKVRGNRWILTEEGKDVARTAALRFRDEDEDQSQVKMF